MKMRLLLLALSLPVSIQAATIPVNCNLGGSLSTAISAAAPGATLLVSGNCMESIIIDKDNLTIDGQGTAMISAAPDQDGISISSQRGIRLLNLSINGGKSGLSITNNAEVNIQGVNIQGSEIFGLHMANNALLRSSGIKVLGAKRNGINVQAGCILEVTGDFIVNRVGTFGLNLQDGSVFKVDKANIDLSDNIFGTQITVGSTAFINESKLTVDRNILAGLSVDSGSSLFMFNSHLSTSNNGLDGINLNTKSSIDVDASSTVTANDNGRHGLNIEDTTVNVFSFFRIPGPSIIANNNAQYGVFLELAAKMDIGINSNLTAQGNGKAGLFADEGSTVRLQSSTITGNQVSVTKAKSKRDKADVLLTFGSRISFNNNDNVIGLAVCDDTSISRGHVECKME